MKKIAFLFLIFALYSCKGKEIIKKPLVKEITIFALDTGKDSIQAKNKALSFLADMRSGYYFKALNREVDIQVREVEINFIMGSRIKEFKTDSGKHIYFCKMSFKDKPEFKDEIKFTLIINTGEYFKSKKEFLKSIIEKHLTEKIKTGVLEGVIYITDIKGLNEKVLPEKLKFTFTIFYRKTKTRLN